MHDQTSLRVAPHIMSSTRSIIVRVWLDAYNYKPQCLLSKSLSKRPTLYTHVDFNQLLDSTQRIHKPRRCNTEADNCSILSDANIPYRFRKHSHEMESLNVCITYGQTISIQSTWIENRCIKSSLECTLSSGVYNMEAAKLPYDDCKHSRDDFIICRIYVSLRIWRCNVSKWAAIDNHTSCQTRGPTYNMNTHAWIRTCAHSMRWPMGKIW